MASLRVICATALVALALVLAASAQELDSNGNVIDEANRIVPESVRWASGDSGFWQEASNWDPARVPTYPDIAVIDAVGTGVQIVIEDQVDDVSVSALEISTFSGDRELYLKRALDVSFIVQPTLEPTTPTNIVTDTATDESATDSTVTVVVGSAIGVIVLVLLVVIVFFLCLRRRKEKEMGGNEEENWADRAADRRRPIGHDEDVSGGDVNWVRQLKKGTVSNSKTDYSVQEVALSPDEAPPRRAPQPIQPPSPTSPSSPVAVGIVQPSVPSTSGAGVSPLPPTIN